MGVRAKNTINKYSHEDRYAVDIAKEGTKSLNPGYEVSLPWRKNEPKQPNNRPMAEMRLKQLLKKFHKDPEYEKEHRKAVKKSGTEIQTLTQPAEWRFVPGDQNVADLATPQQRFHFVQKLINMFWDIWIKKYLLSLTGLGQMEFAITIPIIFPYSTPIDESQPITAHQFDP